MVKGTLTVHGLCHPVLIRRDAYGVPYIEAHCDEDAWFGLGFCHGQDRAFQLEGLLRVVRGTLSEMTGPSGLAVDRLSRRIGFYRAAQEQWSALDDEVRKWFDGYARGVVRGVQDGCSKRAHEFVLLGAQPTPYTGVDALGMVKLVSFSMGASLDSELLRFKILIDDGPAALEALDPAYARYKPSAPPPVQLARNAANRLLVDLAQFRANMGGRDASNNWALTSAHTATGRPFLASDPHLAPTLPPNWYLAQVRTPDWAVAGASFIGGPAFAAGHNGFAAWGLTTSAVDNADLFVQEMGPDGKSVRRGEGFVPCQTRQEVIQVKGLEAVTETVLITPNGPIISPAQGEERGALSMDATWLAPRPLEGMMGVHRARSFQEFRHAFEHWPAFSQYMVYADVTGAVGWQLIGEAPQRRQGWGILPTPGWDVEGGWLADPVAFAEMPFGTDEETGIVVTANGPPSQEAKGPFLGADWLDGYRHARIVQALETRDDWTLADAQTLQLDQRSLLWDELRDPVLSAPVDSPDGKLGRDMLAGWDGRVSADSAAASVFEFTFSEMMRRVFKTKAPNVARWALTEGTMRLVARPAISLRRLGYLSQLIREQPEGWFAAGWPNEIAQALEQAVSALRAHHGDDPQRWAWGTVRPLVLRHPAGGRAPLGRVFNLGPFPWGGDACTISQATVDLACPKACSFGVATLRMVVDLGSWQHSRFVLSSGQSGNPLSPHYADQHDLWRQGKGIPIAWTAEEIEQATEATLHLVPRE